MKLQTESMQNLPAWRSNPVCCAVQCLRYTVLYMQDRVSEHFPQQHVQKICTTGKNKTNYSLSTWSNLFKAEVRTVLAVLYRRQSGECFHLANSNLSSIANMRETKINSMAGFIE